MDNYPRRKQYTACDICRRRKVRCHVAFQSSSTCSACHRSGTECRFTTKAKRSSKHTTRTPRPGAPSQSHVQLHDGSGAEETPMADPISLQNGHGTSSSSEQEKLARTGLALFLKHGITNDTWAVFDSLDKLRIAYVGTAASNISHLVDLHRVSSPSELGQPSNSTTSDIDPIESLLHPGTPCKQEEGIKPLHYPYPPIRQDKAWTPNVDVFGITSTQNLLSDVSFVPEPEIRDALVAAYFEHIHPFLPFLSKDDFIGTESGKSPPLLLYQAVLMAGAHACSHPIVANNRHWLKSILFRRASMLFHIRHETDRIHLMQAAILFTWYTGDGDTVTGGPYYWAGIASRIGCGLGAHRRGTTLLSQHSLCFKLSWWSAFVCDVFSSLDTGRPNSIRLEEIDQLPITLDVDTPPLDSMSAETSLYNIAHLKFLKEMVELAYIGIDIIMANAPFPTQQFNVQAIDAKLGLWSVRSGVFSDTDNDPRTCQLGIHYNLLLLYLHRNNSDEPGSKSVCSIAAQTIVSLFEQLRVNDGLKQCPFTAVNAIMAAGIQIVTEIRATIVTGMHPVAIDALARLSRLLRSASALAEYWLGMESVHTVFKDLYEEYGYITQFLQGKGVVVSENSLEWCDLFTGVETQSKQPNNVEDWMSIIDWNNF